MKILTSDRDYLFDSTVYIDYFRRRSVALDIFQQVREERISVSYTFVTITELWSGANPRWNEDLLRDFLALQRLQVMDARIAEQAGRFRRIIRSQLSGRKGLPSVPDSLIAATAHDHSLCLLTRNRRHFTHFRQFGLVVDFYDSP